MGMPEKFNVLIEIPTGSVNKYEFDEAMGEIRLDYVFKDGFSFPFNYGLIPNTKAEDGDPLDVVVLTSYPINPGVIVLAKPIGILKLKDRQEQDNKIIAVPMVDPLAESLNDLNDLSEVKKKEIADFFKEIGVQKNKSMDIEGFEEKKSAIAEIEKYSNL